MRILQISSILLLLLLFSCKGQEKANGGHTKNIDLPLGTRVSELDDKIWAIYQDTKDNYWFGSNGNGVYFFDGKTLTQFTTTDGLISNTIRGIQEDHAGNIFIETPKGISKYDGKVFTPLKPLLLSDNPWKLEATDLWFNCNGNLRDVYRYDGENLYELKLPRNGFEDVFGINEFELSYSPYTVFGIDKDKHGNIWFGTVLAGAFRYDGKSFLWIAEKELSRLSDGREPGVRSMLQDRDGNMWLSNFISKYKISLDSNSYEKLEGIDPSNKLLEERLPYFNSGLSDQNGDLWMTTYGGGVWKYDGAILENFPIKEGNWTALLISIYQDKQGTLWLGTDNAGVYKYNGSSFEKFEPKKI